MSKRWDQHLGVVERGELDCFERWLLSIGHSEGTARSYRSYVARASNVGFTGASPKLASSIGSACRKFVEWRERQGRAAGRPLGAANPNTDPFTSTVPERARAAVPRRLPSSERVEMTPTRLEHRSTPDLLAGYGRTLVELRRRGVLRTNNPPAGDYGEWLVATALGGTLATDTSAKSYDLTLADGRLVQVKARTVSSPPLAGQFQTSPFRSWDFDLAAFVLLDVGDYRPVLGVLVPVNVVRAHAKPRPYVNGEVVFIRPPLTTAEGVVDITTDLSRAVHGEAVTAALPSTSSTRPPPPSSPAQWATDPYGRFELRYWDGTRWTEHVSSRGVQSVEQQ